MSGVSCGKKEGLFYIKIEGVRPGFPSMVIFQAGTVHSGLGRISMAKQNRHFNFPINKPHFFCLKSKDEHHQILHNLMVHEENRSTTCN